MKIDKIKERRALRKAGHRNEQQTLGCPECQLKYAAQGLGCTAIKGPNTIEGRGEPT